MTSFPRFFFLIKPANRNISADACARWAIPSGFPIPFKNCPKAIQKPLSISQQLSYTVVAVPSGCLITLRAFLMQKCDSFFLFSKKQRVSILNNKAWRSTGIFLKILAVPFAVSCSWDSTFRVLFINFWRENNYFFTVHALSLTSPPKMLCYPRHHPGKMTRVLP